MPDVTGYRAKFAVIIPSTNTVVEHDYHAVGPHGITFHSGRMYIENPTLDSDDAFEALLKQIRASIEVAVRDVLTCKPDYMVMGMSAETFWGGVKGNQAFEERVRAMSGLDVATGATACREALERFGARRLAVLSPYQPIADDMVTRFFDEAGFDVVRFKGLRRPSATAIAEVSEAALIPVLRDELDGADVDAIVQVGTNLSMLRLADEAERWLGKPVLAINAATLWHALRSNGFQDRFQGFGSVLRDL
jgi:maleate isomerase